MEQSLICETPKNNYWFVRAMNRQGMLMKGINTKGDPHTPLLFKQHFILVKEVEKIAMESVK